MDTLINSIKKSWIPSLAGVAGFLTALSVQLPKLYDKLPDGTQDLSTVCDWNIIITAFTAMIIGLSSRQSNVSDEQAKAGVKPVPKKTLEEENEELKAKLAIYEKGEV